MYGKPFNLNCSICSHLPMIRTDISVYDEWLHESMVNVHWPIWPTWKTDTFDQQTYGLLWQTRATALPGPL